MNERRRRKRTERRKKKGTEGRRKEGTEGRKKEGTERRRKKGTEGRIKGRNRREKKEMRVGIFTDTYPPFINGVSTSVVMLKRSLERLGHEVYIVTVNNENMPYTGASDYIVPLMLAVLTLAIVSFVNYKKIEK